MEQRWAVSDIWATQVIRGAETAEQATAFAFPKGAPAHYAVTEMDESSVPHCATDGEPWPCAGARP